MENNEYVIGVFLDIQATFKQIKDQWNRHSNVVRNSILRGSNRL